MSSSLFTDLSVHSQLMGHTKVRDHDVQWITSSQQDVCRAKVTMDDAQGVKVVHASHTLLQYGYRGRHWHHLVTTNRTKKLEGFRKTSLKAVNENGMASFQQSFTVSYLS